MTEKIDVKKFQLACANCSLAELCFPIRLTEEEIQRLDHLIKKRQVLKRGEYLFREGHQFSDIYIIRSGSLKAYKLDKEGEQRITAFYFPGEMLGFHAIHLNRYAVSAVALETSATCSIAFEDLFEFATHVPTLQKYLLDLMSQKISSEFVIDPNSSAEERLAKFLLSISNRLQRRHLSSSEFTLSMSRQDIGNYLGLASETISRIFSRLQEENILAINRREVRIEDFRKLQIMAYGDV